MTAQQLNSGIEAYRNGDKLLARAIFSEIVRVNPRDEEAWLWLSACTDVKEQQIYCLNKVISLNPDNTRAKKGLLILNGSSESTNFTSTTQHPEQAVISSQQSVEDYSSSPPKPTVKVMYTTDEVKGQLHEIGVGKLLMMLINVQLLVKNLESSERIEYAIQGKYKGDNIVLVVTTKRILLTSVGPKIFIHKIPYNTISSVEQKSGFATGVINIELSSGVKAEITDVVNNKKSIEAYDLIMTKINVNEEAHGNSASNISTITEESNEVVCPKCHSKQIATNRKGFGLGKAVVGGVLLGPVGLLGGFIGSGKVKITCIKCGHTWESGKFK